MVVEFMIPDGIFHEFLHLFQGNTDMALTQVRCPACNGLNVVKYGKQPNGEQRYCCQDPRCERTIFLLNYRQAAQSMRYSPPEVSSRRTRIIELALDGADVNDISRILGIPEGEVVGVFQQLSRLSAPPTGVRSRNRRTAAKIAAG
ncbi:MAG: IS1 family transposase [Magnetococcales bacterium]|nr:IS1 family transposase [Magnetococcales bacterium]